MAAAMLGVFAAGTSSSSSSASTVYWDGDGLGAASGGSGVWDTTLQRWASIPGGSTYGTFTNGDTAVFAGTGGTVNFAVNLSGSMDVQSNGYMFFGTSAVALPTPWTWGGSSTLNVAASVTADLRAAASGTTLTKTGAGTLVFDSSLMSDAASVNLNEGTLQYGRSNFVASMAALATTPNLNSTVRLTMSAGTTLDLRHFHDSLGSLNGSGTVILGRQFYSPGLTLTTPSYTYGSTLILNGGNVSATGTPTETSEFLGNIISDGPTNPELPFSGGHLVIGTIAVPVSPAGRQATVTLGGTNTFHGVTTINGGANLFVKNGNALPDDGPVYLIANAWAAPLFELQNDEAIGSLGAAGSTTLPAIVNPNGHTLTLGGDNLNNDFTAGTAGAAIGGIGGYAGDLGGTIVKVGTGNQIIWTHQVGAAQQSTYTGKYVIKGGLLTFPNDKAVGATFAGTIADYFTLDGGTLAQGFSQNATTVWNAKRGITVTDNGGGLYGQVTNNGVLTWDWQAPIVSGGTGIGTLTKSGSAALRFLGADNSGFTGKWIITDGAVIAGAGHGATVGLADKPLGTGSVELGGAVLQATSDFIDPSTDQTMNIASAGTFTYDSGATLRLKKGNDATAPTPNFNNSLTVTVGAPASAAGTAFVRKAGGSGALLLLADFGQTALGTASGEKLLVNGGVATVAVNGTANTVVPTVIISKSDNPLPPDPATTFAGTVSASEGFFATYDATNGFVTATMSGKTDINSADATDLYAAVSGNTNTLAAGASVYGMKIGTGAIATDVDLAGQTLNVGGATASDPGIVIMGMGTNIKASGGGTLAFGAHEAIFYNEVPTANAPSPATPPAGSTFAGTITGSGGFTKMGYGPLNLDSTAVLNYTGTTRINQGMLTVNADDQLPVGTDLVLAGVDPANNFGRAPTLNLNNHRITVNSLNSVNEKNYNSAANAATIYLGTTGVLKITGSGNSNFDGLIASTASNTLATSAGASSTVWMAGSGTLKLGMGGRTLNTHFLETLNNYNKLWITNGGTVVVAGVATFGNTSSALPLPATSVPTIAPDAYMLDNGTLRFEGVGGAIAGGGIIGSGTGNFPITTTINANRGLTVGSGGGTIDVASPYVTVALTGLNASFSGTGTLTKTGPGILALSGPSIVASQVTTARWKLVVKQGTVTLVSATTSATDDNIGLPPLAFDPTNITLDGGTLDCSANGIYTFNPNRGFFIGSNGGAFGTGRGNLTVNGPLSGSGTLTFGGSTTVAVYTFNGSSDGTFPGATQAFTGDVVLARSGVIYANAKNALGTGTIRNDPTWPVGLGTNLTTASVQLDNHIVANAGSPFDFITNGAATDMILSGQISGDGNMYKGLNATFPSTGTLELGNATNNFTGSFTVMQGTLIPRVDGSLSTIAAPLNVLSTGTLAFKGNLTYAQAKPVFVGGTGGIQNISDTNSFAGPITLLSSTALKGTLGTLTLSGVVAGAADSAIVKSGPGTIALTNAANSYRGAVSITGGVLASPNLGDSAATNLLTLDGGTLKATGPLAASSRNVTVTATGGGLDPNGNKMIFGNLTVGGTLTMAASGVPTGALGAVKVGTLTVTAGKVDLSDNKLVTTSPVGTWTGSAYTDVAGLVASGRGSTNLWDGTTGIITSQTLAIGSNYTSIGVAKASDVRPSTATATELWGGQAITGTDTLVMYTYGGDATLDGKINIDDYVKIDSGIAGGYTGWVNGDFNYDGKVSIDDYITVIDANIGNQGPAFSTSSGGLASASLGVTAVPEPTMAIAFLSVGAGALMRRRQRKSR
jgi:autotransporter-associated beta strand protein